MRNDLMVVWVADLLQVDKNAIEFYRIIVERQQPHLACTSLGYCTGDTARRWRHGKPLLNVQGRDRMALVVGRAHLFGVIIPTGKARTTLNDERSVSRDEDWAFVVTSDIHVGQESGNVRYVPSLLAPGDLRQVRFGDVDRRLGSTRWPWRRSTISPARRMSRWSSSPVPSLRSGKRAVSTHAWQ